MNSRAIETSPRLKARIAGGLYFIVIVAGVFAEVLVRQRLIVSGDAAATAHNIVAHETLYRLGFSAELIACTCNMPLALIFYDLFKIVNRSFAWLVVLFTLLGTAVEAAALLADFAPLVLLGGGPSLAGIRAAQLQSLASASLQVFEKGFAIALVFFGFYCLALGYLIIQSIFFPRIIGVLLGIEGLMYVINSFANFLAPAIAARVFPFLAASAVGEISLCLWLLARGVDVERWKEQGHDRWVCG